jgi:hypothetical protein
VLAVLIVYGWMHLCKVWQSTDQVLMGLALLPLHDAFARIPLAISSLFGPYLTSQKPRNRDITDHQLRQRRILSTEYKLLANDLTTELHLAEQQKSKLAETLADTDAATLTATAQTCLVVLQQVNDTPSLADRLLTEKADKKADASDASSDKTSRIRLWLRHVQEFVALEVMIYLSQFSVQMRNLALPLSLLPLLMLFAVTSYPFQPQRLWLLLSVTLIVLVTLTVIFIVIRVERNELMSRIARTTPHQVNFHWTFLSHMLVYALPLLGVIVALSSDLSNLAHAWIDPLIQAMK